MLPGRKGYACLREILSVWFAAKGARILLKNIWSTLVGRLSVQLLFLGKSIIPVFLEDYTFLGLDSSSCTEATLDKEHLDDALAFCDDILRLVVDKEAMGCLIVESMRKVSW